MGTERALAGVAVLAAGIGGWWLGRGTPSPSAECPEGSPATEKRTALVGASRPSGAVPAPAEEDALALALDTIRELETELYGTPVAWTDDVDEGHRPAAVTERVRRVFEECGVTSRLVDMDCDEAPCFAVIEDDGSAYDQILGCPVWTDAWGSTTGMSNRTVACPDGETRRLLMVSPGTEARTQEQLLAAMHEEVTPERLAENENSMKRLEARAREAGAAICAAGR